MITQLKQHTHIDNPFDTLSNKNTSKPNDDKNAHSGARFSFATALHVNFKGNQIQYDCPAQNDELLTYFNAVQETIEQYGGRISELDCDSFLVLFDNSEQAQRNATDAILAAKEMMAQLVTLNKSRKLRDKIPFRIGIGISSGAVPQHPPTIKFEEIQNNPINTASYISTLNKNAPVHAVYVSKQTQSLLKNSPLYDHLALLGQTQFKPQETPVHIYALIHSI
ncbi:MAG: adenylate/guanylate cyclase domain-containing protein [Chloroflexota bacterium]